MRKHDPPEVSSGGFFNAPIEVTESGTGGLLKFYGTHAGHFELAR